MILCMLTATYTNIFKSCNKNESCAGPKYGMAEWLGSKNNPQNHTNILLEYIKGQMETRKSTRLDGGGELAKKKVLEETGPSE